MRLTFAFCSVYLFKNPDQLVGDVDGYKPPQPRRNPNRIGYQVDAAGEKRTARRNGESERKTPRKLQGAAEYIFVV